jgi:rubrerythrin
LADEAGEHLAVLKNAILMELEGKDFFERAIDTVKNQRSKDMFSGLVKQELRHIDILSREFEKLSKGECWLSLKEANSKRSEAAPLSVFKDAEIKRIKLSPDAGELEVLKLGMEVEKKSIDYYSAAQNKVKNTKAKEVFKWLVGEESGHLTILNAEYDYRQKSGYYYDNQEFSLEVM